MSVRTQWKKLIHDSETISYVKNMGDYRVIIEARQYDDGWEIVKKYVGAGVNHAETYSAQSSAELRGLLKHLRSEKDLSRREIRGIKDFKKKMLKVMVRRGWKEDNVEKWYFAINENYSNFVMVRYGRIIDVAIVMEEQLKHIEEKIIARLYEVLGLHESDRSIDQNIYYFSKKTTYFLENDNENVGFEFVFD